MQGQQVQNPQLGQGVGGPPQTAPLQIDRKFLGQFQPLTYCCCCASFTLSCAMAVLTIFGLVVSTIVVVFGIVALAFGNIIGLLFVITGMIDLFFFLGNRGAAEMDTKKFTYFYFFSIFNCVMGVIQSLFTGGPLGAIILSAILTLILNLYILFGVWSFLVRLEAGDQNTLKFGPRHYEHTGANAVVQGQIVEGGSQDVHQGEYAGVQNANLDNRSNNNNNQGGQTEMTAGGAKA